MTHYKEIDGVRALAAIAVVAFHTRLPGFGGGYLGVDLFFLVSGYLTASLVLPQLGRLSPARFLLRRLWRLWPLLLLFSLAVALVHLASGDPDAALAVVPGALFLGNLRGGEFGWISGTVHTWSLATEMQFYALLALAGLALRSRRAFAVAMALGFLATTLSRVRLGDAGAWAEGFYAPWSHSSGLFLGALLATLPLERMRGAGAVFALSAAALAACIACASFRTDAALIFWIGLAELSAAGLLASLVAGPGAVSGWLGHPALCRLGLWSYGIYLWHYPIALALREALPAPAAFAVTLAAATALGALTFRHVEAPLRRFGRRATPAAQPCATARTEG